MRPSFDVTKKAIHLRTLTAFGIALAAAFGQLPGSVTGTVFDAAGDPMPLAKISIVADEGGARRDLIADENGGYRAAPLAPGSYRLSVESVLAGSSMTEFTLGEGQALNLPIVLTYARPAAPLPRDRAEITPGQQGGDIEGYGPYGSRGNMSFNSTGQRGQDNDFRLDGMDNNDSWVRGAILLPPEEAISSMSLSDGYIPAAFGHAAGATTGVASRSGSRELHGSAFENLGNTALDSRNFFDGSRKPGLVSNRFGAALGGPASGRGWFFFTDFEVLRERQDLTVLSTVPTAAQKAGNFGSVPIYDPLSLEKTGGNYMRQPFPNNQIPPTSMPAPSRALSALYPDPNLPGAADNYLFNPASFDNQERFDIRSDRTLSARNRLFFRLTHEGSEALSPGAFPGGYGNDVTQHADGDSTNTNAWGGVVSQTFAVGPSLANELRAGAAGIGLHARANDQGLNASALLGIPGLGSDGLPSIVPTGFTALGAAGAVPLQVRSANYQVADTAAWATARHAWHFGMQGIRRHVDGNASPWTDRGTYLFSPDYTSQPGAEGATGDSFASLLVGFPTEVRRDVQFSPYHLRGWEWAGFAEDQIRIWKRLTVQAGLRLSIDPPVTEADDRMVNFNFSRTSPALDQFAGAGGVNRYGGSGYNLKLAPRIGFALDLSHNGSTVLRGGFSQAFDGGAYVAEGALARNPPYASRLDIINGTFLVGPDLTAGLPPPAAASLLNAAALNGVNGAIYAIQPQHYEPYADQWDLFLQHRLRTGLIAELGGESSMGVHLYAAYDANQPAPAPPPSLANRYPYSPYASRIDYLAMGGGSTYYGGVARLTGRAGPGLVVAMSYAFSKSIDDAVAPDTDPQSRPAAPQYIYFPRGNRGVSPFDITQRAVLAAHYDLPKLRQKWLADWRASTVITLQTGFPFTPELATNSLNNGGYQLPDRVGGGSLPPDRRSYLNWFNTGLGPAFPNSAFLMPALYQYGNSGFDILRGPGLANVDAMLSRSFALRERLFLRPSIEASNLFNRANFALPERILGVESAGVISHTITPARRLQIAMTVSW